MLSHNYACGRVGEGSESFEELFAQSSGHDDASLALGFVMTGPAPGVNGANGAVEVTVKPCHFSGVKFGIARQDLDVFVVDNEYSALSHFIDLSQYTDARIILTKSSVKVEQNQTKITFANPLGRFTAIGGNEISHRQLSFGEKRLLAILLEYYTYPSTLIVDELANGMHHSWIERMMEQFEALGTQAFLTSQNPILLDCLPLSLETYGSRHQFVVC